MVVLMVVARCFDSGPVPARGCRVGMLEYQGMGKVREKGEDVLSISGISMLDLQQQ